MYLKLEHPPVSLDAYRPYMDEELAEELITVAAEMQHLRIAHFNATAIGGGVAEILQSMVPLFNALGIHTERIVIDPDDPTFFHVTKKIHNLLQGADGCLSGEELETYHGNLQRISKAMLRDGLSPDVWFMHDPQLLPLGGMLQSSRPCGSGTWLWICHIDLTRPNQSAMDVLLPMLQDYHHLVFSLQQYVPVRQVADKPVYIAPACHRPAGGEEQSGRREGGLESSFLPGDRSRTAPGDPGLALRYVERPVGSDRRLPPGPGVHA